MPINCLRADFPLLRKIMNGKRIAYLDNASTSHKPLSVLNALTHFYTHDYANVHRGIYTLAEDATTLYERARETVALWSGAPDARDIVFTRGTTESINLVAASWACHNLVPEDEIIIPESEHHANLLPWQQLMDSYGVNIRYAPVTQEGVIEYDALQLLVNKRTKLIALSHVSHVTGAHHDVSRVVRMARAVGARVLLDAAQSAPHQPLNLAQLDVDFCVFSAHKMLGPTGIGALYVTRDVHEQMRPYQTGGGMVHSVSLNGASWLSMPHRLEAGTPAIAQAIGLAAACDYLRERVDFSWLRQHESHLCALMIDGLSTIPRTRVIGPVDALKQHGHLVSFLIEGVHPHDSAAYLSAQGICVRAGHHCAQPLAVRLGLDASVRASFYLYTMPEEVERCIDVLKTIRL